MESLTENEHLTLSEKLREIEKMKSELNELRRQLQTVKEENKRIVIGDKSNHLPLSKIPKNRGGGGKNSYAYS
ncbi:MAG: hypothetical protein WCR20_14935 [Verrucomicrobiota bacterium]